MLDTGRLKVQLAIVIGGIVLAVYGHKERSLAQGAEAEPRTVTLRELEDGGTGSNAHVVVTDFVPLVDFIVVRTKERSSDPEKWEQSWIPLVPSDSEHVKRLLASDESEKLPTPRVRVVLKTGSGTQAGLESYLRKQSIQGMIVNAVESLGSEEQGILRQRYAASDVARLLILEEGRTPTKTPLATAMFFAGLCIALAGVGWGVASVVNPAQRPASRSRRRPPPNEPPRGQRRGPHRPRQPRGGERPPDPRGSRDPHRPRKPNRPAPGSTPRRTRRRGS